jgi:AraC-like DNA-binding protein
MLVAALIERSVHRDAIRVAARGVARVQFCETEQDMFSIAAATWISSFLLEPLDSRGICTAPLVARLRRQFTHASVLVYCDLSARSVRQIPAVTRAGADELILASEVKVSLPFVLRSVTQKRLVDGVLDQVQRFVPPGAHALIAHCLAHPRSAVSVESVARELGISRRTLSSRLRADSLPSAGELVGWARLIAAAQLLDEARGRGLEAVAFAAGFQSAAALRAMFRRYTGMSPSVTKAEGALESVIASFRASLDAHELLAMSSRIA